MVELQCPECDQVGSVSETTMRADDHWIRHYACGECGYEWVEIGEKPEDD